MSDPTGAFEQATRLKASGKSLAEVKAELVASGIDEESAQIAVNALPGAEPAALPQANLSLTTNALAPNLFSVTELGLSGDDRIVGWYWLTFGLVVLLVVSVVVFVPVPELFGSEGPSEGFIDFVEFVLPPVGFGLAALASVRGAYLLTRAGLRFRRKS